MSNEISVCIMEAIDILKKVDSSDEFSNTMMFNIVNSLYAIALHHKNHSNIKTKEIDTSERTSKESVQDYWYRLLEDQGIVVSEENKIRDNERFMESMSRLQNVNKSPFVIEFDKKCRNLHKEIEGRARKNLENGE